MTDYTTRAIEPQAPPNGLTQGELVDFGASLASIGLAPDEVAKLTHRLTVVANQAAFNGATEFSVALKAMREQERLRWEFYTDGIIRKLLLAFQQQRGLMGYIHIDAVTAALRAELRHAEPNGTRPIPGQRIEGSLT